MKALLLVGSPRQGASWKLGNALLGQLADLGLETRALLLVENLGDSWPEAETAAAEADLIILSFPLYVDTLPALVTAALTRLAGQVKGKKLAVLINCGFPEVRHNETALKVCRQFAQKADCIWLGSLALSMGAFSFGKHLARPVRKGISLAAGALAQGQPIPGEAVRLAARTPMPKWLYLFVLNRTFRRIVRKYGNGQIDARPYLNKS